MLSFLCLGRLRCLKVFRRFRSGLFGFMSLCWVFMGFGWRIEVWVWWVEYRIIRSVFRI